MENRGNLARVPPVELRPLITEGTAMPVRIGANRAGFYARNRLSLYAGCGLSRSPRSRYLPDPNALTCERGENAAGSTGSASAMPILAGKVFPFGRPHGREVNLREQIGNLSSLKRLTIANGNQAFTLPKEIGNLTELQAWIFPELFDRSSRIDRKFIQSSISRYF